MKGTNWGRIVGRLTAVIVFVRASDYTYQVVEMYALEQDNDQSGNPAFDTTRILIAATLIALAILLWVFADKFAPKSQEENQESAESDKLIIALVAAIGAFIFLRYASYSFNSSISRIFTDSFYFQQVLKAHVIYGAVIALLGALMVVFARKVAGWLAR